MRTRQLLRGLLGVALTLALLAPLSGCKDDGEKGCDDTCGACEVKIVRVKDGDTVELEDGRVVRFLGIDTPEIDHADESPSLAARGPEDQCMGREALMFTSEMLAGKTVRLEYAPGCAADQFGRSLGWIFLGDTLINVELVRRGFARCYADCVNPTSGDDYVYSNDLKVALGQAQSEKRGLWGACDGVKPLVGCEQ